MVEVSGGAVDDAARGHAHPQRAAAVPAAQIAAGAACQRGQRRGLRAARGRRLHRVQRAAEQVGGHDAGGARADVDAERQERLVVDLDRHAGPADGAGDREVGALAQDPRVQQRSDLAVHRRDAELGDLRDDVTGDRAAQARRAEHRGGRRVGDLQRRRDDAVPRLGVAHRSQCPLRVAGIADALGRGRRLTKGGGGGSAHGSVLC